MKMRTGVKMKMKMDARLKKAPAAWTLWLQENREKVARANPITFVSGDDPPIIIFHGDRDPLVPHHQSVILHDALEKAGVDVTFRTVKGAGHGFRGREKVDVEVDAFFDKHLKPRVPPRRS